MRFDRDQQVDYGDGTFAWIVTAHCTETYASITRLLIRASDEHRAYEIGREHMYRQFGTGESCARFTLVIWPACKVDVTEETK